MRNWHIDIKNASSDAYIEYATSMEDFDKSKHEILMTFHGKNLNALLKDLKDGLDLEITELGLDNVLTERKIFIKGANLYFKNLVNDEDKIEAYIKYKNMEFI